MAETTIWNIPLVEERQDDAVVTHNTGISILDAIGQLVFKSRTTTAQPGSPADGDVYLIPTSATGTDWAGQDGKIAIYINNDWYAGWYTNEADNFISPAAGMRAYVEDENLYVFYDGSSWVIYKNAIRKSADTDRSSTTTTTADPDLVAAVAANRNYNFQAMLFFTGDAANDAKIAFDIPSGSVIAYSINGEVITSGADSSALPLSGTSWPSNAEAFLVVGTLDVDSTPGNLSLKWAQNSSGATATTLRTGSYLDVNVSA
jgi:hypothetical protein